MVQARGAFVVMGDVVGSFGVRGWLKVRTYTKSPDTLLGLLERAGFCDLHASDWRGALPIGGRIPASEAARFALTSFSSFAEVLATGGEGAFEAALRELTARFLRHEEDGAVRMDAWVNIFTGARRVRGSR